MAKDLIDVLENYNEYSYEGIPFYFKVLSSLYFFANGSFQTQIGDCNTLNVSQPSISRAMAFISRILVQNLAEQYVKFPSNENEITRVTEGFRIQDQMPCILGALDCTHITIIKPNIQEAEHHPRHYRNRKKFYSINVEATCDSELLFTSVNARFPGSSHDSLIWSKSPVRAALRDRFDQFNPKFLLADCGYPGEPWLLTPYGENENEAFQKNFNKKQIAARSCIERAFGVLKSTFRCLSKHRTLYYQPEKAAYIIYSCVILYNFLKIHRFEMQIEADEEEDEEEVDNNVIFDPDESLLHMARTLRDNYAQMLHNI